MIGGEGVLRHAQSDTKTYFDPKIEKKRKERSGECVGETFQYAIRNRNSLV